MLHHFQFAPFPDAARQLLYQRLLAALQAEAGGPDTLLLGNFAVAEGDEPLDAVVVRPHSITLLVLVPGGGRLSIPALSYGAWKLDGQPLPGAAAADNPFEQFRQQKEALAAWLAPQLSPEQANLQFISGVVVFGGPVSFEPGVEAQLSQQPGSSFQLLADAAQLPRRLKQLARPEIDLTPDELSQWARELAADSAPAGAAAPPALAPEPEPAEAPSLWRRAWRWLGAEDIPDDAPYGNYPAEQVAASSAEKQRLERIRQESQAELRQQLLALEAREAERERNMAELRAQLAQTTPVTSEAQVLREQLAAESREKAALEEAMRASRAESERSSQELDAKIQQLGHLLDQLHARAAAPPAPGVAPATAPGPAAPAPAAPRVGPGFRQLRQWRRRLPRAGAVLGGVALLGLGAWGLSQLRSEPPKPYQENGKWGFADASGKPVVAAKYSAVGPFEHDQAVVEADGAYGLVDESGQELVAPAYDALNPYAGGYARVRVGDAYTFLDEDGQEFDSYYFNALDFSEGLAAVLDHRGWFYISGPEPEDPAKPPVIFREAYSFREGLARVRLADGYTYISKAYLQDPSRGTDPFGRYETATDFADGKARVSQSGRSFTIDTDGDPVE
jgi:hypothetical protein